MSHFRRLFACCVLSWVRVCGNLGVGELVRELVSFWESFCPLCFELGCGISLLRGWEAYKGARVILGAFCPLCFEVDWGIL